jgi:LPS-assembly lipoprotein
MLASGTNVQLVDNAADAQAILDFMGQNRYREVIALNTKGEAREYELTLKLTFRVASPDGDEYFPATTFTASREITYNEEDYNSRDAEEALLYNEMQEELIIQLLNRLSTIKPHIHAY